MKYKIDDRGDGLHIRVDDVAGKKEKLLQAFNECREGRCSCPTEEYKKLDKLDIDHQPESIHLRLKAKSGAKLDKAEINKCLVYTAERVEKDNNR